MVVWNGFKVRIKSVLKCFHPLEGFGGRVHGRCIQGHRGDPNTEFSADMCCWAADRHLCQLHSSFPENLKKKKIFKSIIVNNNTGRDTGGQRHANNTPYSLYVTGKVNVWEPVWEPKCNSRLLLGLIVSKQKSAKLPTNTAILCWSCHLEPESVQ